MQFTPRHATQPCARRPTANARPNLRCARPRRAHRALRVLHRLGARDAADRRRTPGVETVSQSRARGGHPSLPRRVRRVRLSVRRWRGHDHAQAQARVSGEARGDGGAGEGVGVPGVARAGRGTGRRQSIDGRRPARAGRGDVDSREYFLRLRERRRRERREGGFGFGARRRRRDFERAVVSRRTGDRRRDRRRSRGLERRFHASCCCFTADISGIHLPEKVSLARGAEVRHS